jgi:hypothetical protein
MTDFLMLNSILTKEEIDFRGISKQVKFYFILLQIKSHVILMILCMLVNIL